MVAPIPMVVAVGERVEIVGGSKRWVPGVVITATEAHYVVRFDTPMLASTWEGRPRKFDGTIAEIKVHRTGFEGNSIRKRA